MGKFKQRIERYLRFTYPDLYAPTYKKLLNDWLTKSEQARSLLPQYYQKYGEIKNKKLLDFGCGVGQTTIEFTRQGAIATGIDNDEKLISMAMSSAREEGIKVDFSQYNGEKLPFQDNSFDLCICWVVFEHVSNPRLVLSEITRVLKKGGILWINFPNRLYPWESHVQLYFVPWMPLKLANLYSKWRGRSGGIERWSVHFYSYYSFIRILRRNKIPLKIELAHKIKSKNTVKKSIFYFLKAIGIHHSALQPKINLFLVKY